MSETIISIYNPETHQEQLLKWIEQWGLKPSILDMLPSYGLIIEDICAVFLYETNSKVCFMDYFISNKDKPKQLTDSGLDLISHVLFQQARQKGYKYIVGNTKHKAVADRSLRHGFTVSEPKYYICGKVLNGDK